MTPSLPDPVFIVPYSGEWPDRFHCHAQSIRDAMGGVAVRIDHIGSTAVPGLDAKPVIDIQVSIPSLDAFARAIEPMQERGYIWRVDNPDLTKRYFRERPGLPRTHIHVRALGSFSEQFALLFRDYLRHNPLAAAGYGGLKRALAERYRFDRHRYVEAKEPAMWSLMHAASAWSQVTGWEPGPPDA